MCTVLLPPGGKPIAVNEKIYIIYVTRQTTSQAALDAMIFRPWNGAVIRNDFSGG
jgi:hypothetical protein